MEGHSLKISTSIKTVTGKIMTTKTRADRRFLDLRVFLPLSLSFASHNDSDNVASIRGNHRRLEGGGAGGVSYHDDIEDERANPRSCRVFGLNDFHSKVLHRQEGSDLLPVNGRNCVIVNSCLKALEQLDVSSDITYGSPSKTAYRAGLTSIT